MVALGLLGRGPQGRVVTVAARSDTPADHILAWAPIVAISQVGQERDRVLVDRVERPAVVAELASPVAVGAPGWRLGDEAAARFAGNARVAFEVMAQPATAVGRSEQNERGEFGKLNAVDLCLRSSPLSPAHSVIGERSASHALAFARVTSSGIVSVMFFVRCAERLAPTVAPTSDLTGEPGCLFFDLAAIA